MNLGTTGGHRAKFRVATLCANFRKLISEAPTQLRLAGVARVAVPISIEKWNPQLRLGDGREQFTLRISRLWEFECGWKPPGWFIANVVLWYLVVWAYSFTVIERQTSSSGAFFLHLFFNSSCCQIDKPARSRERDGCREFVMQTFRLPFKRSVYRLLPYAGRLFR
jgi:hypothetical protein